jgi:Zn-dependent protease/predicted transcriptional regulator
MRWSLRIARVAGISVYVHITFILLPLWVGFSQFSVRQSWAEAGASIAFVFVLFGIVVLHELGHALTARRFGIRTRDITLLPIGGVARLDKMPEDPKQELLVALAGPAVNVALAVLLFAIIGAGSQLSRIFQVGLFEGDFLPSLMWVNIALVVFNLIPAFPMDGGRVLRALLALRMSYVRATNVAAGIGQTLALVFAFVGLSSVFFGHLGPISNPFLLFIALFVWMGARAEAAMVQMKSVLGGVPVSQLMITDFRTLSPQDPLSRAAQYLVAGSQHDFPVTENDRILGLLTRGALVHGLVQCGQTDPVGDVMLREFTVLDPAEPAEKALFRLRASDGQTLIVAKDGRLEGILTADKIREFLLVRGALNVEGASRKGTDSNFIERKAA